MAVLFVIATLVMFLPEKPLQRTSNLLALAFRVV
jgi:hypothetical protein